MAFLVQTKSPETGEPFWLRRAGVWTTALERAYEWPTADEAQAALVNSKKFNKAWAFKNAKIVED